MNRGNPWDVPGWSALAREARLVRQLIGSGVTALGKANYADGKGNYYVGFFGLAIGLERLAKLVLVADYTIENNGRLPQENVVRRFGHELSQLAEAVNQVAQKHGILVRYARPTDSISSAVLECLDSFADAQRGRYVNFGSLGDPTLEHEFEPIKKWWDLVTEPILKRHFYGSTTEARVRNNAHMVAGMMSGFASILFFGEDGAVIDDAEEASLRTGKTEFAQKYWRYSRWESSGGYRTYFKSCPMWGRTKSKLTFYSATTSTFRPSWSTIPFSRQGRCGRSEELWR